MQSIAFQTGPGFRARAFSTDPRARARRQEQATNPSILLQLVHLLPLIVLLLFSLLSFWEAEDDPFSFNRSRDYPVSKETDQHYVKYYVNPQVFNQKFSSPSKLEELNQRVERDVIYKIFKNNFL